MSIILAAIFVISKLNRITPLSLLDKNSYNAYSGVAIKGYDPVCYFVQGSRKGNIKFQTEWKGVTWWFDSQSNMDLFLSNPEHYSPQFGGYCAFAVITGFTATIDPTAYVIQDEKLYLFNGQDLKINFSVDLDQSIKTANKKWYN